ncbi:leucine-rich repeat domain-containing protein [Dyadobacter sp. CY356]|uniref:leucine-rich repeat domain-containing protein n=1 Tax=Dyadobacter sp. CY356 TaxID=2906442 RepID=UPI001F38728E|nr:leucine-rich repeat domain-containing protein [Dyadobacter sp. CY356]MCF0057279.1 leucine-rich repeat domain-containing protein [Dyadobacter sp. CY356]
MKIILSFILMLIAQASLAQVHIWTHEDAKKANFPVHMLPEDYEEHESMETMSLVEKSLNAVVASDLNPGISVFAQVLVNQKGSVDYLIFNIEPTNYDRDSLNQVFKKSFSENVTNWKLTEKPQKPFRLTILLRLGKQVIKRQVRQTDSSVVNIEEAIAFKDSLKIKKIFFNQLELKSLPDVIYRFPNTEEIYLSGNELTKVKIEFKRLPRLKQLHLDGNKLTNKNLVLTKNKSLELLNLKENKFTNIPAAARACKNLSSFGLGGNKLSNLSDRSFRKLKKVRDLNFYKSEITILPKGIKKMKGLEVLDLYYNQLESLPASITGLKNLTQLAVSHNQLKALPEHLGRLTNVHTLYAHHNKLSKLPASLAEMKKLNVLDLGYNWFYNFPNEIMALDSLHELDISGNNLPEFPSTLVKFKKLDKVYLRGNPFINKEVEKKYASELKALKGNSVEVFY